MMEWNHLCLALQIVVAQHFRDLKIFHVLCPMLFMKDQFIQFILCQENVHVRGNVNHKKGILMERSCCTFACSRRELEYIHDFKESFYYNNNAWCWSVIESFIFYFSFNSVLYIRNMNVFSCYCVNIGNGLYLSLSEKLQFSFHYCYLS